MAFVIPDVIAQDCATRQALERLATKWGVLLIYALLAGPQRHAELRRRLPGITQKVLTETLRGMETDGWCDEGFSSPPRPSTSSTPSLSSARPCGNR